MDHHDEGSKSINDADDLGIESAGSKAKRSKAFHSGMDDK